MDSVKQTLLRYIPYNMDYRWWMLSIFGAAVPLYAFYYMFGRNNADAKNTSTLEKESLEKVKSRVEVGDLFVLVSHRRTPGILKFVSKAKMYLCALVIRSLQDSGEIQFLVAPPVSEGTVKIVSLDELMGEEGIDAAYWLPLSAERRELLDILRLSKYAGQQKDKSYQEFLDDVATNESFRSGAPKSQIPFVCSSILIADALRVGQVLSRINPITVTANDLVRWNIFADRYYQVKGNKKPLPGFNTVVPEGFGIMSPDGEQ